MEENTDDNKIFDNNNHSEKLEFRYNFINLPWDDRSNKSKIGIVVLLVSIFVATMALVADNFARHFRGFQPLKTMSGSDMTCLRVRNEDYLFIARIHNALTQQLLCVGAVVSPSSVLVSGVCVKSGPVRMFLGNGSNPRCRKGFSVDVYESVHHDGVISKKLFLLSSYESIESCSEVIRIGDALDWSAPVHILGRPFVTNLQRSFSRQHGSLFVKTNESYSITHPAGAQKQKVKSNNTICVKYATRCPVRAGDLLIQNSKLYGLSSTSMQRLSVACFADLNYVKRELKELDIEIYV